MLMRFFGKMEFPKGAAAALMNEFRNYRAELDADRGTGERWTRQRRAAMTNEEIDAHMAREMEWAKRTKRVLGYSTEDNFPVRVSFIQGGEAGAAPRVLAFGRGKAQDDGECGLCRKGQRCRSSDAHQRYAGTELKRLCGALQAETHRKTSGTRRPLPSSGGSTNAIMEQHDNYMGNLPKHLYTERLGVAAKGPSFGAKVRMQPYTRGSGKSVLFLEEEPMGDKRFELGVLTDWWTIPDDAPKLVQLREEVDAFLAGRAKR